MSVGIKLKGWFFVPAWAALASSRPRRFLTYLGSIKLLGSLYPIGITIDF